MRLLAAVLCLLALAVVGCSKSKAVAPRLDSRGTQLGTAGTFDEGNLLLWSAATNEILGTASFFGTTFPSGALVAMDGATGATRVLDPET